MLRGEPLHFVPNSGFVRNNNTIPNTLKDWVAFGHADAYWGTHNEAGTISRVLSEGDFNELNQVLRIIELPLPDIYFQDNFLGSTLDFWATQVVCSNIQVQNVTLSYEEVGETGLSFKLSIEGVTIDCELDFRYVFFFKRNMFYFLAAHSQ